MWGVGKAEALRREGATVYVGDHVHDVAGARAAGALSVSVLTGGCTRDELLAAGTDVVLEHLGEFPAWLEEHLLTTRLAALEADLRARARVLVAYSGGADSAFLLAAAVRALGPDRVARRHRRTPTRCRAAERDPAREFARSLGVEVHTPAHARDGARGLPRERRRPLLLLQGRAARRPRRRWPPSRGWPTSPPAPTPTTRSPASARASAPPPSAARSPRCATPGSPRRRCAEASRRWGLPTWDKPAAACLSSRVAYGIEVTPHRLARVERAEAAVRAELAAAGVPVRDLRVRDLGERASVEVDAALVAGPLAPARR